jgi:membrane dipeptidase
MTLAHHLIPAALGAALAGPCATAVAQAPPDTDLVARARAIHERVIALDTHNDINPANFTRERNYTQRLDTQVNLPKMEEGGLDASFLVVYVGQRDDFTPDGYQRAYEAALEKFAAIHRLADTIAPDRIGLAYTAADVRRIAASGRKVALIAVENGYPIGEDLTRIRQFYDLGARTLSLTHNGHNQLSDSNTGERDGVWRWHGLSPLGRAAIAELNRVGVVIDVSHPSRESMMQTVELSQAPIIASHSAVRALCDDSRNLDDEQLVALAKNGGVAQIVALSSYVKAPPPPSAEGTRAIAARARAIAALRREFGLPEQGRGRGGIATLTPERRAEYQRRMTALDEQFPPPPRATVKDFVDHIDYAVKLIGIDHVGISSDFDGGGGVDGWNDASETFNVTLELVRRGYTEEQIAKLWSGNMLRVMDAAEAVARRLQAAAP